MKKFILYTFIFFGSVLLFACSNQEDKKVDGKDWKPTSYKKVNDFEGFSIQVKEDSISKTGLIIELINDSGQTITYGDPFTIEKEIDGKWYEVPTIIEEYGFNDIGYEIAPSKVGEQEIWWEWLYGSIDSGNYRIIKTILDVKEPGDYDEYVLSASFMIDE